MEKRLFLAIGLSMMIVWLWSASAPKRPLSQNENGILTSEKTGKKEQNSIPTQSPSALTPTIESLTETIKTNQITEERIETISSDNLSAEISNIGASLNSVTIREYDSLFPIQRIASVSGYENLPFILDIISDNEVSYSYLGGDIKIVKTYKIRDGDYIIESGIEIFNMSDMSKLININIGGYSLEMSNLNDKEIKVPYELQRDKSLLEYVVNSESGIHRKASAFKFAAKEQKEESGKVFWSGFRNRYFCALIKPQYDTAGYGIDFIDENQLKIDIKAKESTILPRSSVRFDSLIFVGPEKISTLKEYGMGFEKIKKYYRFGLLDGVAKIIAGMMHWIHNFVPSWGVNILIISVIIYFSMYPLTLKGMLSMKKMQSLQPMIAKLKEKHKDNPQKMNKEMMEIYKEHKVNPLGGCLPMLLQMPVFIGLYQVLWRSVEFKGAKFLWIDDLSKPDNLFTLPFKIPWLGNEFNLLPIIMIVVMYAQQKLTTKSMVITDPAQAAQQKMMTTIMPVFIGAIFYKFASGLTLYFTMFYIFSTLTQWKMSKMNKGS